jgi:hypothetical protein
MTFRIQSHVTIMNNNRVWYCAPTHRHVKLGGLYEKLHEGLLEGTMQPVTIYRDESGQVWVRPTADFEDGRFEPYSMPVPGETSAET